MYEMVFMYIVGTKVLFESKFNIIVPILAILNICCLFIYSMHDGVNPYRYPSFRVIAKITIPYPSMWPFANSVESQPGRNNRAQRRD